MVFFLNDCVEETGMKAVMDSIMDDDSALFEEDTKKKQTPSTRRRKNKIELFCWLMIVEAIVCILRLSLSIQFEVSDKKQNKLPQMTTPCGVRIMVQQN